MKLPLSDKLEKPEGFPIISQSWFTTSTYGRSILRSGRFTQQRLVKETGLSKCCIRGTSDYWMSQCEDVCK